MCPGLVVAIFAWGNLQKSSPLTLIMQKGSATLNPSWHWEPGPSTGFYALMLRILSKG